MYGVPYLPVHSVCLQKFSFFQLLNSKLRNYLMSVFQIWSLFILQSINTVKQHLPITSSNQSPMMAIAMYEAES